MKKKTREVLTEKQIQTAFREYENGASIYDLADALHVCTRTLERMFSRRGLHKHRKVSVTFRENRDKM